MAAASSASSDFSAARALSSAALRSFDHFARAALTRRSSAISASVFAGTPLLSSASVQRIFLSPPSSNTNGVTLRRSLCGVASQ